MPYRKKRNNVVVKKRAPLGTALRRAFGYYVNDKIMTAVRQLASELREMFPGLERLEVDGMSWYFHKAATMIRAELSMPNSGQLVTVRSEPRQSMSYDDYDRGCRKVNRQDDRHSWTKRQRRLDGFHRNNRRACRRFPEEVLFGTEYRGRATKLRAFGDFVAKEHPEKVKELLQII